jgi:uncharacterized membrane protein
MLFAEVLLILCIVLIYDQLTGIDPMHVTLESGESIPVMGSSFDYMDAIIFIITSFVAGASFAFLFLSDGSSEDNTVPETDAAPPNIELLLTPDERNMYNKIKENDGQMLQKDLVTEMPYGGVKVSRIITRLEKKGVAVRYKHGLTNRIALKG